MAFNRADMAMLPVIQSFKAPGSDREVQLRLYNHVYVFTTTVGTQTDSEVFYMNGKPARAVHPFRVVPKKPREIVARMADLELALAGPMIPVYGEPVLASVQYVTAMAVAPMEEQQYQEVAVPIYEQPEQQEMPQPEASGSDVRERISQETQTDIELFNEEEEEETDDEENIAE